MISHKKYMDVTIKLAERGKGQVSPNPLVGCIIVKRGRIVGRGYHKKYGQDHAEIMALKAAGKKAVNATMYCNLEPCSHWGKTPPCTERVVESGIREVIIGTEDPNPLVEGFRELKFRGIKTKIGIRREQARKLNETYFRYTKTKNPFVILKVAMSLDGKIATSTGDSKYITSKEARKFVHEVRNEVDAVMVGINTVLRDNPQLNSRLVNGKDPIKVIVDSTLKIPEKSKVLKDPSKVIIATTKKASKNKIKRLHLKGINVIVVQDKKKMVNLTDLMKELGKNQITSVMIEGGAHLNASSIADKIVDKVLIFTAPKIIGNGMGAISSLGIKKVNKAIKLKKIRTKQIGKDLLVEGYL